MLTTIVLYRNTQQDPLDIVKFDFISFYLNYSFVEQIRIELIPPVLQTGVHTMYTTIPFVSLPGFEPELPESKSSMLAITSQTFEITYGGSSKICTYSALKQRFYRPTQLSPVGVLPFYSLGSRTRTYNLLHPKQVNNQSLSSQFFFSLFSILFFAAHTGIEPVSPERQSGRLASNPNKPGSFLQYFL